MQAGGDEDVVAQRALNGDGAVFRQQFGRIRHLAAIHFQVVDQESIGIEIQILNAAFDGRGAIGRHGLGQQGDISGMHGTLGIQGAADLQHHILCQVRSGQYRPRWFAGQHKPSGP